MTIIYISLSLTAFLAGFHLGKMYILKGLRLRAEQLYQEGEHREAKLFEAILDKHKK